MFVLSSLSSSLESWSINYTLKYRNSELKAFKDITLLDKYLIIVQMSYLEQMYKRLLKSVGYHRWQH